jgi:hypothetical protein
MRLPPNAIAMDDEAHAQETTTPDRESPNSPDIHASSLSSRPAAGSSAPLKRAHSSKSTSPTVVESRSNVADGTRPRSSFSIGPSICLAREDDAP